mmetsp:Transcript_12484/g.17130  ORF Transcript_12484/g.17130 Transcript_12484/m.17130 type:complete len:187 (+) Transcript_12484:182-742(+)
MRVYGQTLYQFEMLVKKEKVYSRILEYRTELLLDVLNRSRLSLGFYEGELLSLKEYRIKYPTGNSEYVFLLNEDSQCRYRVFVDALNETLSNFTRFINHDGEQANCVAKSRDIAISTDEAEILSINNSLVPKKRKILLKKMSRQDIFNQYRIGFYTTRDIEIDEELTFDYGQHFSADWNNALRTTT